MVSGVRVLSYLGNPGWGWSGMGQQVVRGVLACAHDGGSGVVVAMTWCGSSSDGVVLLGREAMARCVYVCVLLRGVCV